MTRTHLLLALAVLIALLAAGAYWYTTRPEFDATLRVAFEQAADVYAYTQEDITETIVSDRKLRIEGVYRNDARTGRYASIATTTVFIPDAGDHAFKLENISLGETVYTRIMTESALLKKQIAFDSDWHQFQRTAIPREFESIAISGPILDHLQLFTNNGAHLDYVDGPIQSEEADGARAQYSFKLASNRTEAGGTLATFMERINDGIIRIWIDETHTIRRIVIDNDTFHSTTTLSRFNEPLSIDAPPLVE